VAWNYDIAVSLTNKAYTSQTCPNCGHVDSDNRKSQEEFECLECGYKDNADRNSSLNIVNRLVSTVLRDELHKKSDDGTFKPRICKKEKVKEMFRLLESEWFFQEDRRREDIM